MGSGSDMSDAVGHIEVNQEKEQEAEEQQLQKQNSNLRTQIQKTNLTLMMSCMTMTASKRRKLPVLLHTLMILMLMYHPLHQKKQNPSQLLCLSQTQKMKLRMPMETVMP